MSCDPPELGGLVLSLGSVELALDSGELLLPLDAPSVSPLHQAAGLVEQFPASGPGLGLALSASGPLRLLLRLSGGALSLLL